MKNNSYDFETRIHINNPVANQKFATALTTVFKDLYTGNDLVIMCVGTDRSTGDSLGPLTGTKLTDMKLHNVRIYGTLNNPVHACNLQETIEEVNFRFEKPFIIAIDACLGRSESVGYLSIKPGSLQPGTGVNKDLPSVGDLQIIGIVNVGGFMEYMVLQNTRLSLVMKMADIISQGIATAILPVDTRVEEFV